MKHDLKTAHGLLPISCGQAWSMDVAKQADIGVRINAALEVIEADKPRITRASSTRASAARSSNLAAWVSWYTIGFGEAHHAKDMLGEVCEYFQGHSAITNDKKGSKFYMPTSAKVLVETLTPHQSRGTV